MVPCKMTTYAQAVNNYVDSRRAGLNTDRRSFPPCYAPYINPEWFEMRKQYHGELDKLRQDWALEILGRRWVEIVYFHHLRGKEIILTEWPARNRGSIKTLAKRLKVRLRSKKQSWWAYWEFHVKQGLSPLRWGPLQDHYMRLKTEIEDKYGFLGLLRLVDLGKNRFFPTEVNEILYRWPQWYPGQDNLRVQVHTVSTPPEHNWISRVFMTARDGTVLYTGFRHPHDTRLRYCVDDWRNLGFPR